MVELDARSLHLRRLAMRAMMRAGRGHPGPALSIVEILRVLYDKILDVSPSTATDANRDVFILSKGHGCLALYAILADKGFIAESELDGFCGLDSRLAGHPEFGIVPGIEASTGALGHGLSLGVGRALGKRFAKRKGRVFVLMGDGELNEGAVWESAMSAAKHELENLILLVDCNGMQSWGPTGQVTALEPLPEKWRAFGFTVREVDGHDTDAIEMALSNLPVERGRPMAVLCRTVKGKGLPAAENNADWHHKNKLSDSERNMVVQALGEI